MSPQGRVSDASSQSGSEYENSDLDTLNSDHSEESPNPYASENDQEAAVDEFSAQSDDSHANDGGVRRSQSQIYRGPTGPCFKPGELYGRRKSRRLKGWYIPKYRQLYNSTVENAGNRDDDNDILLEPSTIGASHWTSEEKSLLFSTLKRCDRADVRAFSSVIVTKTESEIRDYLHLLQQGSIEDYMRSRGRTSSFSIDQVPAAFEVDPSCDAALDMAAENLAYKVEIQDQKREQERHGRYWLLTPAISKEIENSALGADNLEASTQPNQTEADKGKSQLPVPATALLRLPNWLELANLFMSLSVDRTTSWVDLIEHNDERPSIYYTAFGDFYTLAVDLTKRLVYAAMFQAMSRIRATQRLKSQDHVVRHSDVQAACRTLGLRGDWLTYWVHAPRRLGLEVWTRGKAMGKDAKDKRGSILTHDQVETALHCGLAEFESLAEDGFKPAVNDKVSPTGSGTDSEQDGYGSVSFDSDFWTDGSVSSSPTMTINPLAATETDRDADIKQLVNGNPSPDDDFQSDVSSQSSTSSVSPAGNGPRPAPLTDLKAETAYLDALDQQASRAHQSELWAILKKALSRRRKRDEGTDADASNGDNSGQDIANDGRSRPRKRVMVDHPTPPLGSVKAEHEPALPTPPLGSSRRERLEHVDYAVRDWRDKTEYVPAWMRNTPLPGPAAFEALGRRGAAAKRKRMEKRARLVENQRAAEGEALDDDALMGERDDQEVENDEEEEVGTDIEDQDDVASDTDEEPEYDSDPEHLPR